MLCKAEAKNRKPRTKNNTPLPARLRTTNSRERKAFYFDFESSRAALMSGVSVLSGSESLKNGCCMGPNEKEDRRAIRLHMRACVRVCGGKVKERNAVHIKTSLAPSSTCITNAPTTHLKQLRRIRPLLRVHLQRARKVVAERPAERLGVRDRRRPVRCD